jgi:FkbM family methyltransferase
MRLTPRQIEDTVSKFWREVTVDPPFTANFCGVFTDVSFYATDRTAQMGRQIPLKIDRHAGEHAALLLALDEVRRMRRTTFSMAELGAAWGPWISEAGVIGAHIGLERMNLVGVEAHEPHFRRMTAHMQNNGLSAHSAVSLRLLHGAVWHTSTKLKFPRTDDHDFGATAANFDDAYNDTKRRNLEMVEIEAFTLEDICDGIDIMDFMHWDIQGAEAELANANIELMNARVRSILIGTHSRPIEGRLIQMFFDMGWDIIHEVTCEMNYNRNRPTIEKMTNTDGMIYARNPRLWEVV